MFFHPHIDILIPAVALSQGGCQLRHPRNQGYFIPEKALAYAVRRGLQSSLKANYAGTFTQIEAAAREKDWVAQCKAAGRGRTALPVDQLSSQVSVSSRSGGRGCIIAIYCADSWPPWKSPVSRSTFET